MNRFLPRPLMTGVIVVLWAMLNNSFGLGTLLFGLFVGWLIPIVFNPILLERRGPWHPLKLAKLLTIVSWEIITSNFHVARLNLGPVSKLRPAFLEVPVDLTDDVAISILVSIVSMTPGTISADLSEDKKTLLVHGLDIEDPDAVAKDIKERWEARLKEVYPC